ncbi:hypothetical protein PS15m_011750 [Mucor circinelloides]
MLKDNTSSSPKRFFRGVKSFLRGSNNNNNNNKEQFLDQQNNKEQEQNNYSKDGIAVTLTTDIHNKQQTGPVTLLHPNLTFLPSQSMNSTSLFQQEKAYVHYEPKRAQVALGINPDAKHTKIFHLTVEQYAWLIQQLQEEQGLLAYTAASLFHSPMLGIMLTHQSLTQTTKSIGKRLIRFVQQRRKPVVVPHRQCIFMLPKALLLQAAAYIPVAKPLPPPPQGSVDYNALSQSPYEVIPDSYYLRLKRYCRYLPLCTHELLVIHQLNQEPSPPSSFVHTKSMSGELVQIQCADCPVTTGLHTIVQHARQQPQEEIFGSSITARLFPNASTSLQNNTQSIMFPVSYVQYNTSLTNAAQINDVKRLQRDKENQDKLMSSAIQPDRRALFNSIAKRQKPHAFSAFQYIPPDRTMSSSGISSISEFSGIEQEMQADDDEEMEDNDDEEYAANCAPQKYGYVAVDTENEEILVVFPGMSLLSHTMFENASFAAVPWLEIETITSRPPMHERKQHEVEEDISPWVLECALTAWHRCEMRVVTLLMRLCGALPSHYKVVIVGHSLGGAVAALCASSLRSTKLLMNRSITVCAVHSPRVGNKSFLKTLSYQRVDTIRITDDKDLMAHLPPRTSGLLHLGDSTVILPTAKSDGSKGHSLQDMTLSQIEDTLNKTFNFKNYDMQSHNRAWDVCLDDDENSCL